MWEESFKWLEQHYHGLAILVVGIVITWFFSSKYFHWTHRVEKTESDCNKIDSQLIPQLNTISASLVNITSSFNNLVIYLQGKDGKMDASLFMSNSPIELTDLAKNILQDTGGKYFVDSRLPDLIKELDLQNINTALDAQIFAPIIISKFLNTSSFKTIKDYIFKNPFYRVKNTEGDEISIPLDISVVTNILGIYLRNIYLQKRPELISDDSALVHK